MVIFHVHRYEELIAQIFTLLKLLYIFSTMTVKILILLFKKYSPILKFHMEPTTKETHQSKTIMRGKKKHHHKVGASHYPLNYTAKLLRVST